MPPEQHSSSREEVPKDRWRAHCGHLPTGSVLDVQVFSSQFAKYEAEPIDMSESAVLLDDVADAAGRQGMRAVSPLTAIQPVGDPAYLDNDLHLSADGHAALAEAINETLEQLPLRLPGTDVRQDAMADGNGDRSSCTIVHASYSADTDDRTHESAVDQPGALSAECLAHPEQWGAVWHRVLLSGAGDGPAVGG